MASDDKVRSYTMASMALGIPSELMKPQSPVFHKQQSVVSRPSSCHLTEARCIPIPLMGNIDHPVAGMSLLLLLLL